MTGSLAESPGGARIDIVLVGGGLANGLIAHRLKTLRPDVRLLVLEAGEGLGGNHTWSFHEGDLTAAEHRWLAPFIVHRWPGYEVRFPARGRKVSTGYLSATSDRFLEVLGRSLDRSVRTGAKVVSLNATSVTLDSGERIDAGCVIDGRGPRPSPHLTLGFQKFLGQEIELTHPHGLDGPIVMDATIPQSDGYRFVYVLPLGPKTLLIEDTYYADGPDLDPQRLRAEISAYAAAHGWTIERVVREEDGILPIALGGDISAFWDERADIPCVGLAAALFHPTTGYSLPDAVRVADLVAGLPDLSSPAVFAAMRRHSTETWKRRSFFRMLNRLLFFAGAEDRRYEVLQHFYRLPDPLVARFYAARLSMPDRLRILTGKPPVPFVNALRVIAAPSHIVATAAMPPPSMKDRN